MKIKLHNRMAVILLVEDNAADQRLIARALENSKFEIELVITTDGQEALNYLEEKRLQMETHDAVLPDLIILDMNLPKMNGKEFLRKIRSIPHFKLIPVIMFSTSEQKQDIIESYELGANAYIIKPIDIKSFYDVFAKLEDFWLSISALPGNILTDK